MHLNAKSVKCYLEWNYFIARNSLRGCLVKLPRTNEELLSLVGVFSAHPDGAVCPLVCTEETYFVALVCFFPTDVKAVLFTLISKLINFSCSSELKAGAEI